MTMAGDSCFYALGVGGAEAAVEGECLVQACEAVVCLSLV